MTLTQAQQLDFPRAVDLPADYLDGVLFSGVLVPAFPADWERSISQDTLVQVDIVDLEKGRVLEGKYEQRNFISKLMTSLCAELHSDITQLHLRWRKKKKRTHLELTSKANKSTFGSVFHRRLQKVLSYLVFTEQYGRSHVRVPLEGNKPWFYSKRHSIHVITTKLTLKLREEKDTIFSWNLFSVGSENFVHGT